MVFNYQLNQDKLKVISRNFNFNDDFIDIVFDHILEENDCDKITNNHFSDVVQLITLSIDFKWYCQSSHVLYQRIQRSWKNFQQIYSHHEFTNIIDESKEQVGKNDNFAHILDHNDDSIRCIWGVLIYGVSMF